MEYNASTHNISDSRHDLDEVSDKLNTCVSNRASPKKDTAVQTGICLEIVIWFKIYLKWKSQVELSSVNLKFKIKKISWFCSNSFFEVIHIA